MNLLHDKFINESEYIQKFIHTLYIYKFQQTDIMKNSVDIIFTKHKFNKDYFILSFKYVYKERIKSIFKYIYYIFLMNEMIIKKYKYAYYRFS